ncbi:hypothetical protein ACFQZ2_10050, partial [Streptomonospora algeriensis]
GGGGRPPSPEGGGGRGGEGAGESDRPEPPSHPDQQQPHQDGPEGAPADDQPADNPSVSPGPSDSPGDAGTSGPPAADRPSSGSGQESSGRHDGEQGLRQEDQLSDAERNKRLENANITEQKLRDGGLTDEEISRLFGEHPRHGDQWNRVHSAFNQQFPKGVRAELEPQAIRFAFDGANDPREFSYRYEYFHALFKEQAYELKKIGPSGHPGVSRSVGAMERMNEIDVPARLESDHEEVRRSWDEEHLEVPPDRPAHEIEHAIRQNPGKVTMGHPTSAAYHARKHFSELPLEEQGGNTIESYHQSAMNTLQDGRMTEPHINSDGSVDFAFRREYVDARGKEKILEARLVLRPDGVVIMKTYGAAMGG